MQKKVIFISVQPDDPYFFWQVEVFIHNFMKSGVPSRNIHVLFSYENEPSQGLLELAQKYKFIKFFFYKKTPVDNFGYIPILRPDALEQHFRKFPHLSNEIFFYHDSDIIFRELPNFDSLKDDEFWYLSDTISYIGGDYIKSKSDSLLTELCQVAGIDRSVVEENENNSGGAQYLLKEIDADYWADVNKVTLDLYKYMSEREVEERKTLTEEQLISYNPIQKWCADMWGVLWCGWKRGLKSKITPEFGFSWGSSSSQEWSYFKIMHNAGAMNNEGGKRFYKAEYMTKSPFDADLSSIDPANNTWNYVQAILSAKERRKSLWEGSL